MASETMFRGLDNMLGPLQPDILERLRALMDTPSVETWENAHGIQLRSDRMLTLWQAITKVDPTFPRSGRVYEKRRRKYVVLREWARVPDAVLVARAIRFAREA